VEVNEEAKKVPGVLGKVMADKVKSYEVAVWFVTTGGLTAIWYLPGT